MSARNRPPVSARPVLGEVTADGPSTTASGRTAGQPRRACDVHQHRSALNRTWIRPSPTGRCRREGVRRATHFAHSSTSRPFESRTSSSLRRNASPLPFPRPSIGHGAGPSSRALHLRRSASASGRPAGFGSPPQKCAPWFGSSVPSPLGAPIEGLEKRRREPCTRTTSN